MHLTMDDLKKAYEAFNTEHCLFIVHGDESSIPLFKKYLQPHPGKPLPIVDCFTYKHDILYTHYNKENTTIYIGFPSTIETFFLPYVELLLHHLLFYELRTKHEFIYDISIRCNPSRCGVLTEIEMNVQNKNAEKAFHCLLDSLQHYQKHLISSEYIEGIQKTMFYKYKTDYSYIDYYALFIYQKNPLTKKQIIEKRKEFRAPLFRTLCKTLCPIDKALCVYQSKQQLPLTWN